MAECLGGGGGGNVSRDSVMKWTEKLSNVLFPSTAIRMFRVFLETRDLKDGLNLLDVWEKCDKFQIKFENSEHHIQER